MKNTIAKVYHQPLSDTIYVYRFPLLIILALFLGIITMGITLVISKQRNLQKITSKNEELSDAIQKAKQANEAKTQFLSRMSHDMRTPMNGILGLSHIIEDQISEPEVRKELHQLRESGDYLMQLINDILDINKIESGNLTLNPKLCDEEAVFNSIIELIEPVMNKKNIQFSFEKINIDWKWMMIDSQRVKQIFLNILSNAAKFTPEGGKIDFTMELVTESDSMVKDKFVISDNGIGMSSEFIKHAFEPFAQENKIHEGLGGSGLGLSIVKNLVELMDGSIELESDEGKGSTFTLYLSFPVVRESDCFDERSDNQFKCSFNNINVLICEDHPLNAHIATKLLEKKGASVTVAENGRTGLNLFSQSEPYYYSIILMDIRMPEMDGLTAAKKIRSLEREDARVIPIIAMTANAYESDIQAAKDSGMNAHIAKPVDPDLLYRTIARFISKTD